MHTRSLVLLFSVVYCGVVSKTAKIQRSCSGSGWRGGDHQVGCKGSTVRPPGITSHASVVRGIDRDCKSVARYPPDKCVPEN